MQGSEAQLRICVGIAGVGGFLFGVAACFAIAFVGIMLGCPEGRGQDCEDAFDVASSIFSVWYLFAVSSGGAAGLVAYRVSREGSLPLRAKMSASPVARWLIYATAAVVSALFLIVAALLGGVTSYRAGLRCPAEAASKCSEAGAGEIVVGILMIATAVAIAVGTIVVAYRVTRTPTPLP